MAKIFVSTNKSDVKNIIELNEKAGFKDFTTYESEHFSLVVFKKKIHPIDNFYQDDNGNFVALVGTGFYNGMNGADALKGILEDFNGDILKIQEQIIGNYLLAIYKEGSLYFVTDTYQVIKSYYTKYDNGWAVSNDYSGLMSTKGLLTDDSVDYFGLLSETFLVSSFSKNTLIKNINRLFGFEYLYNTKDKLSIQHMGHRKNTYDLSKYSREKIAQDYATSINKYINIIKNNFGDSIGIHQTGGLDNRTILASFLNNNIKPTMLYGTGNCCLTNTRVEDLNSVKTLENQLGLKLRLMDWSHDKETIKNQNWKKLFENYGTLYSLYSGSHSFFDSYENNHDDYPKFMECGYFLENLRLREFAANIKSITLEQFVDEYLLGGSYGKVNENTVKDYTDFKKHLTAELCTQAEIYGIDLSEGINQNNFDEVRWIHARHTDTIMVNFLNLYTSSFSIFSQPDLHEYPFSIPAEYRANASFQLMVIKTLYPKLLEFPFFSHQKHHSYDVKNVRLTPIQSKSNTLKQTAKHYIKSTLGDKGTNYLLAIKRKLKPNNKIVNPNSFDKIITDSISETLSKSSFNNYIKIDLDSIDLRYPMRLVFALKAIEYSNSNKIS